MWFYFALLSAFFNAIGNIARRTHGSLAQPVELSWWSMLFGMPLGIGLLLTTHRPYYTSTAFIAPMVITALINTVASVLQFRAYKLADASVISPIANLLPIFLIPTSFLMLGVLPGKGGIIGILLIVVGVYYSSVSGKHDLLHPLQQLISNRGSRSMLGAVALWSISGNLERIALRSAVPALLLVLQAAIMFICLSIILLVRPQTKRLKRGEKVIRRWGWHIAAIAVFATLSVYFQYQAVALIDPSYVLAVKRLDVLITILFAGLFLREKHILKRFEGSVIALIGVVIIFIFK
ncbi:MAG: DMT family transporter [Patescibacteria group bacterium]|nr:DMT family transporter [Patescibacteria group bacterium]